MQILERGDGASPSRTMLRIMLAMVHSDGSRRVKPSVYLRPIAQPISSARHMKKRTAAIAWLYRSGHLEKASVVMIGPTRLDFRPTRAD